MPFFLYASFPNSRVKPRPSTQEANTYQVTIFDLTFGPVLIAGPNSNRTYIILKNLSISTPLWYVYADPVAVDPTLVPTLGVTNQCVLFGTQLYQKQDEGLTTNWIAKNINFVGESIDPLQSASLDQTNGYIYASSDAVVPVVPDVIIGVDEGRG